MSRIDLIWSWTNCMAVNYIHESFLCYPELNLFDLEQTAWHLMISMNYFFIILYWPCLSLNKLHDSEWYPWIIYILFWIDLAWAWTNWLKVNDIYELFLYFFELILNYPTWRWMTSMNYLLIILKWLSLTLNKPQDIAWYPWIISKLVWIDIWPWTNYMTVNNIQE